MTRTISLIIGIAVTALVVAVPAAFGEGRLAGSQEQNGVAYFNANERATLASSQGQNGVAYFYANERATLAASQGVSSVSRPDSHETTQPIQPFSYIDAAERADRISSAPGRDVVLLAGDDHVTFQPVDSSTPVASTSRDFHWPQVGIGLGIGIALALGLIVALRATRQRPLAH